MRLKVLLFLLFSFLGGLVFNYSQTQAATGPYDVDSSVRTGWSRTLGDKSFDMRQGKTLVYDVYMDKYTSGGHAIIWGDYGKGREPFLKFHGWAVNFGHYRHTADNHETYIVAQNTSTGANKVYGTTPINISATEDGEYNNQGAGIWNECAATSTNKSNIPSQDNGCNMSYNNVGFNAFIPLNELFPDSTANANWRLYIVKRVNSHIVYSPLVLPFSFSPQDWNGGKISLSSGINTNTLTMVGTSVLRRYGPGTNYGYSGYFTTGSNYTRVDQNESRTAIWYGVNVSGSTRWTSTMYWKFGGSQAILSFDAPPKHISTTVTGHDYQEGGNIFWSKPNESITVAHRQYDQTANARSYIRIAQSGVDARAWHDLGNSSAYWFDYWHPHSSVGITGAYRSEKSTNYATVQWTVVPKTHGHKYDIEYYYEDSARNSLGYLASGKKLYVDGQAPTHVSSSIVGAPYQNGSDYWVKSNTNVTVTIRQHDPDSGNRYQYLRLSENGSRQTQNQHDFQNASSTLNNVHHTVSHVTVNSATRTENTDYGTVQWAITPKQHGHNYSVERYFTDNVGNAVGYDLIGNLRVDDVNPTVQFRNSADTANFPNRDWSSAEIRVRLKHSDADSGYKRSRYHWSTSTSTPAESSWSSWTTSSNYEATKTGSGQWYLHVQSEDNLGNRLTTYSGPYKFNTPPVADFTWSPVTIYNDTNVQFDNKSTDGDGHSLTYQWAYKEPNSTTWVNFSTAENPARIFSTKKGQWEIRLTVSDGIESNSVSKPLFVYNRAPVPDFSWSPTTIYNDTTVTFSNLSTDADKDPLTYQWSYQMPGSSTWVDFSTSKNPSRILNKQEVWKIRLVVSDGTAVREIIKNVTVLNRKPIPNFTATPNPTDRLTTVTFTNASTDPDKDTLAYVWEYRIKGTTTWTRLSTSTNTSFKFPKVATYEVRLTASDNWVSESKTIDVIVKNIKPTVEFSYELPASPLPNEVWEGDTVKVCAKVMDVENDPMTVKIFIKQNGGTEKIVLNQSNLTSGSRPCYTFVTEVGRYDLRVTVNDGYDEIGTSTWFNSKDLILVGDVKHTLDWSAKHSELGHAPYQFYSGEKFLLEADVSPYPIDYVTSTLSAQQSNSVAITRLVNLSKVSNIFYKGELYDQKFLEYPTNLKVGPASFLFKVRYVNGVIEEHTVPIEIIADGFEQYRIHRKY